MVPLAPLKFQFHKKSIPISNQEELYKFEKIIQAELINKLKQQRDKEARLIITQNTQEDQIKNDDDIDLDELFIKATETDGDFVAHNHDHVVRQTPNTLGNRVATKILEDFGGALNKASIRGREPVSIIHYTRPGTCINCPLHYTTPGSSIKQPTPN